jgi:hypothetical protein
VVPRHIQECGPVSDLPLLVSCQDQCAIGWSACQHIAAKRRIMLLVMPDSYHRDYNSTKLACQKSRHFLWAAVVQLTLVWNLNRAPWSSAGFWKTKQDIVGSCGCSLAVVHRLPSVLGTLLWPSTVCSLPLHRIDACASVCGFLSLGIGLEAMGASDTVRACAQRRGEGFLEP